MRKIFLTIATASMLFVSCSKEFDNVEQTSRLSGSQASELVEEDPEFLSSYVSGLASWLVQFNMVGNGGHDDFGLKSIDYVTDVMGMDIVLGAQHWGVYDYLHDYWLENYARPRQIWTCFYTLINNSNEIIDFFGEEDPTDATLRGYLGQAYALRAFGYMNLILYFQDICTTSGSFNSSAAAVPIIYATRDGKTSEEVNQAQSRNTIADVCTEIERNLDYALNLLDGYTRGSKNEVDLSVAQGFAARYYLMSQQWEKAQKYANAAKTGYSLMDKARLLAGFMDVTDAEVMWGFAHNSETQTTYASFFSQMSNDSPGYAGLNYCCKMIDVSLYNQIPATDFRKSLFNGPDGDESAAYSGAQQPYAARKFGYKSDWTQNYLYMRAAEMYLIEAEAALRAGNSSVATSVMKEFLAKRDPSNSASSFSVDDILLQRRIELWGDGLTYYDIRRNGLGVDRTYEGTNHKVWGQNVYEAHTGKWIFQIPLSEIQNNSMISEDDQN